ncbi:protein UXT isoform X2 [Alligator mississippiensis]|uniref:protein UXT isoform X2 n=1 Tax=Alligator mississippiensis TaxID=8496 RepID=UPI0003D0CD05|nr:protein UXT isoform X2 [Alligator mississippiensis]
MAPAEKVQRYEAFVSDVLQRDLQHVLRHRDAVFEQLAQLLQLRNVLERLQDLSGPLQTQVDLGCNVYVSAEVPDPSRVCVALGYGFFAELTLPEALHFIHRRSLLLSQLSETLTKDSAKIKANIRLVLEGLRELQGLKDLPEELWGNVLL